MFKQENSGNARRALKNTWKVSVNLQTLGNALIFCVDKGNIASGLQIIVMYFSKTKKFLIQQQLWVSSESQT